MPTRKTTARARAAKRKGHSPSTQAGAYVHEEIEHIREGKHGARSAKQAIAIGLSKARRAGVKLPPPRPGTTSARTRRKAEREYQAAQTRRRGSRKASSTRAKASLRRLEREPRRAASHRALSRQAREAAPRAKTTRRRNAESTL